MGDVKKRGRLGFLGLYRKSLNIVWESGKILPDDFILHEFVQDKIRGGNR